MEPKKARTDRKPGAPIGGPSATEASKAWLDELVRTGQVVDVTEEAMRQGLAAFVITGLPERSKPEDEEKKPDPGT